MNMEEEKALRSKPMAARILPEKHTTRWLYRSLSTLATGPETKIINDGYRFQCNSVSVFIIILCYNGKYFTLIQQRNWAFVSTQYK